MRLLHLSDLHLGRRLYDVSLLEDQKDILRQVLSLLDQKTADGVILAGDVYDKSVPSAEAVRLLDWFLTELVARDLTVFIVSGNHDSAERLSFGSKLLDSRKIYIAPVFDAIAEPITIQDRFGEVCVHLLSFVKPIHVRRVFPDAEITSYTEALQSVVNSWNVDQTKRNILVAHQLVTGAVRSESESISIGGLDDVSADVFSSFDYVALGHLHRVQKVCEDHIRYCGTPLAYSFSEGDQIKTVTWVELREKGVVVIEETPLHPIHPVRTLKGMFSELVEGSSSDYLRIILTDEEDINQALSRLRYRYPNLIRLEYDNLRMRAAAFSEIEEFDAITPMEMLESFFSMRNGQPMNEAQRKLATEWMEVIWEGDI